MAARQPFVRHQPRVLTHISKRNPRLAPRSNDVNMRRAMVVHVDHHPQPAKAKNGQHNVPLSAGRLDRVREDVEFSVYGRAGDYLQPRVTLGRQVGACEGGHADARERAPSHRLEPNGLIGRASFGRGDLAPVAL